MNFVDPSGMFACAAMEGVRNNIDGIQLGLDAGGFIPVIGIGADALNAAIDAARGDWALAGVGILSAVPIAGDSTAGVAKTTMRAARIAERNALREASKIERIGRNAVVFRDIEVRAVRDLSHLDIKTLELIAHRGFSPTSANNKKLSLHHLNQNPRGPLVELPNANHNIHNRKQHPYGNEKGTGLTKEERLFHDKWRKEYWKERAKDELLKRNH